MWACHVPALHLAQGCESLQVTFTSTNLNVIMLFFQVKKKTNKKTKTFPGWCIAWSSQGVRVWAPSAQIKYFCLFGTRD